LEEARKEKSFTKDNLHEHKERISRQLKLATSIQGHAFSEETEGEVRLRVVVETSKSDPGFLKKIGIEIPGEDSYDDEIHSGETRRSLLLRTPKEVDNLIQKLQFR